MYHEGERWIQNFYGEDAVAAQNGAAISPEIPKGALGFLSQQNFLSIATPGLQQEVWVSPLFGHRGFVSALDQHSIRIDLSQTAMNPLDPLWENLHASSEVGLLALELSTRRRLKIIGKAVVQNQALEISVDQAFALCPKYIQRRVIEFEETPPAESQTDISRGLELDPDHLRLILSADTAFVGSRHPGLRSSDSSHRGGPKGFIQWLGGNTFRIPDYPGNSMFNTFGNLHINPSAGMLFLDFENQSTLQLTGTARIRSDIAGPTHATKGTGRVWDFYSSEWIFTKWSNSIKWKFVDDSPFLPMTTLQQEQDNETHP